MILPHFARLEALLGERVVILDGAMGTMVQNHRLSEADYRGTRFADWPSDLRGNHDLLNLTDPGARNTSFDELVGAYTEAVDGLVEGGADLLLVETVFDTLNCQGGALRDRRVLRSNHGPAPAGVGVGHDHRCSGRTLSGQTTEAFWNSIRHGHLFAVGLNCALGAKDLRPLHRGAFARLPTRYVSAIRTPVCRTPSASTTSRPRDTADILASSPTSGFINIVGGCCGTTPDAHPRDREGGALHHAAADPRDRGRSSGCRASSRSTSARTRCS
jgi:5-methyltetrahydrofolate--homocysteine methyltransferase